MSVYNLSPIFKPQFVAGPGSGAGLVFAPSSAAGGIVVPAGYNFQINTMRAINTGASPISLTVWRLPSGIGTGNSQLMVPASVNLPVASNSTPWFDLGVLWGAVLAPGDGIWALAAVANTVVVVADGATIQI
jgi:hypothetical protein